MNIQNYKLSRLYLNLTSSSLLVLFAYYFYKYIKDYDSNVPLHFNFLSCLVFFVLSVTLLLLTYKFKVKDKFTLLLLFFILSSCIILSYDFIDPRVRRDNNSNILVMKRLQTQGVATFLKNYHKPNLYKIKTSPPLYDKFLDYDKKYGLNLKTYMTNIDSEPSNIILPDKSTESRSIKIMTGNYSPVWFLILSLSSFFPGDSYFSQVVLPANILALLFLVSLYFFLGLFYKKDEYRDRLSIIFIVLLLPIFSMQAIQITNVMFLGIVVQWVVYFLLKNTDYKSNYKDVLAGFFFSLAVLLKFTSLTLMLPITLFYLIRFKTGSLLKLPVFALCSVVLPALMYILFEYNMILNIIIGSTAEFTLVSNKFSTYNMNDILWIMLYQPYYFGIPFIILLTTHAHKIKHNLQLNDVLIFYMFGICFLLLFLLLWRSRISRHWFGFIAFTIPLLVYIYNYCDEKNKMLLTTSSFLIISNLLLLLFDGIIMVGRLHNKFNAEYWN